MIAFPVVLLLIGGTAFLTALVSTALPYVPQYWNTFKTRIRRVFTHEPKMDVVDVVIIAKLQDRIDDLQEQINNLAEAKYIRDKNRKHNIRRDVREYLQELAETKKEIK